MLLEYVDEAMAKAVYDKVEDGTYCGKISKCPGVVALADTLYKCERALRSALEGWAYRNSGTGMSCRLSENSIST